FFLTNRSGKQVLNTHFPWGSELAAAPTDDWQQVIETGRPRISDVYVAEFADGAPSFNVSVPVMRGKRVLYVLSASISPERILEIFERSSLGDGWVATVTDRSGK